MSQQDNLESLGIPSDCHPKVARVVNYWLSIKPEGRMPGRQHVDPTDIPDLLHGVWLIDVRRDPLSFAFRLVGTSVVDFFGKDPTGQDLHDVFDDFEETFAYKDFCDIAETGTPRWRRGRPTLTHLSKFTRLERVYLPFARNGTDVDMIFCFSVFNTRD